jgi:hypothetical protein
MPPTPPQPDWNPGANQPFELEPEDPNKNWSEGVGFNPHEPVIPISNAASLELADDTPQAAPPLPTRSEVSRYISEVGDKTAIAGREPALTLDLLKRGFTLKERIEFHAANGPNADPALKEAELTAALSKNAAHELHVVHRLLSELYGARRAQSVIETFASDVCRRISHDPRAISTVVDHIDRARLTFLIGSGAGLPDEETSLGGKSNESRDRMQERAKVKDKGPVRLTQEQKLARTQAKKDRLRQGIPAADDAAQEERAPVEEARKPVETGTEQKNYEEELRAADAQSRQARLADSQPTEHHRHYENPEAKDELKLRTLGQVMAEWIRHEVTVLNHAKLPMVPASMKLHVAGANSRSEAADLELKDYIVFDTPLLEGLGKVIDLQSRVVKKSPGVLDSVDHTLAEKIRIHGAEGLEKVRILQSSVSPEVALRERQAVAAREAERAAAREGWKNDVFSRDLDANGKVIEPEPPPAS